MPWIRLPGDKEIASSYTASTLVSGALRLNYSYKGKYMATATARADGSSRFAEGNRWGLVSFRCFGMAYVRRKLFKRYSLVG